MENEIIKIDVLGALKKLFGFEKENSDMKSIEKEVERIRKISDGYDSPEDYYRQNAQIEKSIVDRVETNPSKYETKIEKNKDSKGIERE